MEEELELALLSVDPALEKESKDRLKKLRDERDNNRSEKLLSNLKAAAEGTQNLMPLLVDCVEGDCTLGEITDALRKIWGEYRPQGLF